MKFQILRVILKDLLFTLWIQLMAASPNMAKTQTAVVPPKTPLKIEYVGRREILKNSMISYRAVGGYTGVKSYSVVISCVNGKISALSSINDPRIKEVLRRKSDMTKDSYVMLWKNLNRLAILEKRDAPNPKRDILDQFTINFEVKAGSKQNQFKVVGCSRPEAAQYFAIRSLLDKAVGMDNLWDSQQKLASR